MDKHITSQPVLQQHWFQYRGSLKTIKLDPTKYNCSIHDINQLENICDDIELTLLSGKIFEVCIVKYVLLYYLDQFSKDKYFIIIYFKEKTFFFIVVYYRVNFRNKM